MMKAFSLLGYASGIAANNPGCGSGPLQLQQALLALDHYRWVEMLYPEPKQPTQLELVALLCQRLATLTQQLTQEQTPFAVIGGDHSSAIGTWSGVHAAIGHKPLGLIWIDAHLDSHTMQTTPSGNIHGMPLACLLGHGDKKLTEILSAAPKILPENLCIIGARSYEPEEYALLQQLKVKIFFMEDIKILGLQAVMEQALQIVTANTVAYGISLDIDAIDPQDAPGVGCPEPGGIRSQELHEALKISFRFANLLGIEIVEFNPQQDENQVTIQFIIELLNLFITRRTSA